MPASKRGWTMSSEISTDVAVNADAAPGPPHTGRDIRQVPSKADDQLQPWQLFVLAALACATAITFMSRGQGAIVVVLFAVLMGSAALVGLAALRTVRPLVSPDDDRTAMIGHRTRVALEREKMLALRSIKELEFDRAMGKV